MREVYRKFTNFRVSSVPIEICQFILACGVREARVNKLKLVFLGSGDNESCEANVSVHTSTVSL